MKSVLTTILFISLVLTGCGFNNNTAQNEEDERVKVQNSTADTVDREESNDRASHLAQLAERIPEVENATAIVIGNFAVVAIDVDQNLERSEVGAIKYSVAESMKDDPDGANAMIVADPDLTARVREVAEDFQNGHPIQGVINELADITGRVIPMLPADNLEPHPKDGTEKPKEKLGQEQEQDLNKTQNRQSNYHKDN